MNPRLTHRNREASEEEEQEAAVLADHRRQHQRKEGELTFDSVEELLRHDAGQTTAPPALAARVMNSIAGETAPDRPASSPWWKRWLPF